MKRPSLSNDNRRYAYNIAGFTLRPEYQTIAEWIPDQSRVIDLGCGNGSFMHYLLERKSVEIEGIDRSRSGISHCIQNGLKARDAEIDHSETYSRYASGHFDFAVCNVTLHMVMYPETLVREMSRIAQHLILSFPNFGHILNRLDLLFTGRMPRPQLFGYRWFDTGQIHQLGLRDFYAFCRDHSLKILRQKQMGRPELLARNFQYLFARTCLFLCATKI